MSEDQKGRTVRKEEPYVRPNPSNSLKKSSEIPSIEMFHRKSSKEEKRRRFYHCDASKTELKRSFSLEGRFIDILQDEGSIISELTDIQTLESSRICEIATSEENNNEIEDQKVIVRVPLDRTAVDVWNLIAGSSQSDEQEIKENLSRCETIAKQSGNIRENESDETDSGCFRSFGIYEGSVRTVVRYPLQTLNRTTEKSVKISLEKVTKKQRRVRFHPYVKIRGEDGETIRHSIKDHGFRFHRHSRTPRFNSYLLKAAMRLRDSKLLQQPHVFIEGNDCGSTECSSNRHEFIAGSIANKNDEPCVQDKIDPSCGISENITSDAKDCRNLDVNDSDDSKVPMKHWGSTVKDTKRWWDGDASGMKESDDKKIDKSEFDPDFGELKRPKDVKDLTEIELSSVDINDRHLGIGNELLENMQSPSYGEVEPCNGCSMRILRKSNDASLIGTVSLNIEHENECKNVPKDNFPRDEDLQDKRATGTNELNPPEKLGTDEKDVLPVKWSSARVRPYRRKPGPIRIETTIGPNDSNVSEKSTESEIHRRDSDSDTVAVTLVEAGTKAQTYYIKKDPKLKNRTQEEQSTTVDPVTGRQKQKRNEKAKETNDFQESAMMDRSNSRTGDSFGRGKKKSKNVNIRDTCKCVDAVKNTHSAILASMKRMIKPNRKKLYVEPKLQRMKEIKASNESKTIDKKSAGTIGEVKQLKSFSPKINSIVREKRIQTKKLSALPRLKSREAVSIDLSRYLRNPPAANTDKKITIVESSNEKEMGRSKTQACKKIFEASPSLPHFKYIGTEEVVEDSVIKMVPVYELISSQGAFPENHDASSNTSNSEKDHPLFSEANDDKKKSKDVASNSNINNCIKNLPGSITHSRSDLYKKKILKAINTKEEKVASEEIEAKDEHLEPNMLTNATEKDTRDSVAFPKEESYEMEGNQAKSRDPMSMETENNIKADDISNPVTTNEETCDGSSIKTVEDIQSELQDFMTFSIDDFVTDTNDGTMEPNHCVQLDRTWAELSQTDDDSHKYAMTTAIEGIADRTKETLIDLDNTQSCGVDNNGKYVVIFDGIAYYISNSDDDDENKDTTEEIQIQKVDPDAPSVEDIRDIDSVFTESDHSVPIKTEPNPETTEGQTKAFDPDEIKGEDRDMESKDVRIRNEETSEQNGNTNGGESGESDGGLKKPYSLNLTYFLNYSSPKRMETLNLRYNKRQIMNIGDNSTVWVKCVESRVHNSKEGENMSAQVFSMRQILNTSVQDRITFTAVQVNEIIVKFFQGCGISDIEAELNRDIIRIFEIMEPLLL